MRSPGHASPKKMLMMSRVGPEGNGGSSVCGLISDNLTAHQSPKGSSVREFSMFAQLFMPRPLRGSPTEHAKRELHEIVKTNHSRFADAFFNFITS